MSGSDQHPPPSTAPAVIVVPMNYAGEVLMLHADATLTLPAGPIAAGESAEDAARRVLRAATGFKAEALFALSSPAPEDVHLFLARNLEPVRSMTDPIYQGTTERVPLADIDALIAAGRLDDPGGRAALIAARAAITGTSHVTQHSDQYSDQEGADHG